MKARDQQVVRYVTRASKEGQMGNRQRKRVQPIVNVKKQKHN
jgi:hypothetical protein